MQLNDIEIKIENEISSLKECWTDLAAAGTWHCFQSFEWVRCWVATIGEPFQKNCLFVVLTVKQKVVLILPLVIENQKWGACLTFLGKPVTDLYGPIFCHEFSQKVPSHMWKVLWAQILIRIKVVANFDYIHIFQIPSKIGGIVNPLFHVATPNVGKFSYLRNLESSLGDFQGKVIKPRMAADSRRCLRKLSEIGNVTFRKIGNDLEGIKIVDWLLTQKHLQLRSLHQASIFEQVAVRNFFMALLSHEETSDLSAIFVGDEVVAAHFGAIANKKFCYLIPAHLGGVWSKYSVGRLLLEWLFERSIKRGDLQFDFTIGAEVYKDTWCNENVQLASLVGSASFRGFVFCTAYRLREVSLQFLAAFLSLSNWAKKKKSRYNAQLSRGRKG